MNTRIFLAVRECYLNPLLAELEKAGYHVPHGFEATHPVVFCTRLQWALQARNKPVMVVSDKPLWTDEITSLIDLAPQGTILTAVYNFDPSEVKKVGLPWFVEQIGLRCRGATAQQQI